MLGGVIESASTFILVTIHSSNMPPWHMGADLGAEKHERDRDHDHIEKRRLC